METSYPPADRKDQNNKNKFCVFALPFFLLTVIIMSGWHVWHARQNNFSIKEENNIALEKNVSKISLKSSGTSIHTEVMEIDNHPYAHYIHGPLQSIDIVGKGDRYGFELKDDALQISKLVPEGSNVIASVGMDAFIARLIQLQKTRGPDPNGYDNYFSREDMSLNFKNEHISLKIYLDEIEIYEEAGKLKTNNITGLVLFTPLEI